MSPLSIAEVRIADEASDTEAEAARDAAARLQEVVREADTEAEAGDKSPREALESLGRDGYAAWDATPAAGKLQIIGIIGLLELLGEAATKPHYMMAVRRARST